MYRRFCLLPKCWLTLPWTLLAGVACLVVCQPLTAFAAELPLPVAGEVEFARDILPIFERSCLSCHGVEKRRSGFRLDQRSSALKGGELGVAILPGRSAESQLIRMVAGLEPSLEMPPKGDRLTPEEIGQLRRWIDDGAQWPSDAAGAAESDPTDWWSLKPLVAPAVPKLTDSANQWVRNPIDAFVMARLTQAGLKPSPEADRRTLVRRVYFDLIGLPPSPEVVDEFVKDSDPQAYERLVNRLLESPQYGERWARHWLDLVHFAESHGHDQDRPRECLALS